MKSWARAFALGLLLGTAIGSLPAIAAPSAVQILLDKANYWRLKDRPDLAIQALQQLLSIDPNQPDALYQYGMIEVQQGKLAMAKGYLARLQKAAPANPRIADLENAIRAGQVSPSQLSEARRLAQSGQFAAATQKYEQTFRGPPPSTFGVEYYMTRAGAPQGWEAARRGLENLVQTAPDDSKAKLALGQVLTYHAETRTRGIHLLAQLADDPLVGKPAVQAWKQALLWLGAAPQDRPLYSQYLAKFPQDAEIRQHIAEAAKLGATGPGAANAVGYNELNRGQLAAAEREFAAQLRRTPGDANALAGLGLVRLRQQRFAAARDLLGRAIRAAPAQRGQWAAAYESAAFWATVNQANAAIAGGDYRRAQAILNRLVSRPRSINWNADLLLGDADARLGQYAAAEAAYRRVLAAQPDNPTALVGLYTALTAEGKTAEAAGLSARVAALGPGQLAGANRARAELLRSEGTALEARGDDAGAQSKYAEAIAVDPNDPWARLDYARFLARHGNLAQARQIIDPAASGGTAESLQAAAVFYNEQNRPQQALALLDRIPPGSRTPDIVALHERLAVSGDIDRAKALARAGNPAAARNLLMSLSQRPPATAEKARLIADALADIGDTQDALRLARPTVATAGGNPRAILDYAALLFRAGRDAEAVAYLAEAERSGRITPAERRELEHVKSDIAAKRADQLRTAGDLAGAYDQISPLLSAYPNDPTLLNAAGRIYAQAGQNDVAMRFFDAAYRQAPGDVSVIRGAVGGAIQAGDLTRAQAYLAAGMRLYPNNPRLYYLAAQIARANGDNGAAFHDLQIARRLDTSPAGGFEPMSLTAPQAAPPSPPGLPPNPFRQSQTEAPPAPLMLAAATSPVSTSDGNSPPAPPPSLQDTVASADSADLLVPPRTGERPPRDVAGDPAVGSTSRPRPAASTQLALLPAAGDPDLEKGADRPAAEPPAAPQHIQLAQREPLPPPPIQGLQTYQPAAPTSPPAAAAPLAPLPPPPIQGYQPPFIGQTMPTPANSLELDIERSMAAIAAEAGPVLQGGLAFRARSGEDGLSRLTEIGGPIETIFSPFYTGTARLQAIPDYLTAGTITRSALPRFGHEALLAPPGTSTALLPNPGGQNAGGISLNAGYAYRIVAGEIGTTPLGFPVENIFGRVALMWPGPALLTTAYPTIPPPPTGTIARPLHIKLEGVRQPVTDSLLSFAGTKDPVSGLVWGGVVKTGGDLFVSYDDGFFGIYGGGGGGSIDGKSVAGNSELEGIVGAYVRPYRTPTAAFKVGLNLSYMGYDKNLRFFTFGQGGYFSPQTYLNVQVPLEYTGRYGRLAWIAGAALGVEAFHEDRSPFFPTEAGSQAALQAAVGSAAFYPARDVVSPSFFLNGQIEYQLDNGFSIGGLASVDNAQNFTEGIAKLYLRKSFAPPPGAAILPNPFGSL